MSAHFTQSIDLMTEPAAYAPQSRYPMRNVVGMERKCIFARFEAHHPNAVTQERRLEAHFRPLVMRIVTAVGMCCVCPSHGTFPDTSVKTRVRSRV